MDDDQDLTYEKLLGEGAYGKVFLVKQDDGEKFAVKEIDLCKCDETGRDQALREAELLSRLNQPNILKYIESVVNDDCLYIVTEYCDGGDMEEYLQVCSSQGCAVPESLASEWLYQLGGALNYLHQKKILHRDMKTKNIFLKKDLTVKLGDLGIAKVLDLNQSKADTFIGTPAYMSPELFMGQPYNHKTDIWGLGCCAYEILTFRRAFEGRALWTIIKQIKEGKELELPSTYSLELRTLVHEMISQQPEDRPSARDVVENTFLQYHKGRAEEDVRHLPTPDEGMEKKSSRTRKGSGSSGSAGKKSSSLKSMLESKRIKDEEAFRDSIAGVLEKINTLRLSHRHTDTVDSDSTFIYRGDDDDDDDATLNTAGTFVYHGEDDLRDVGTLKAGHKSGLLSKIVMSDSDDSDSDYSTDKTVRVPQFGQDTLQSTLTGGEGTLLQQYTSQLETLEDNVVGAGEEEDSGRGSSPVWPENVEKMLIRKPPKKLKDTFEVRELKKSRAEAQQRFKKMMQENRLDIEEEDTLVENRNGELKKNNSRLKEGMSLSASFSSYGSSSSDVRPRLTQTFSLEDDRMVKKDARARHRERKTKSVTSPQKPKEAFIDISDKNNVPHLEQTDISVKDIIQHLRSNLSPQIEEDSDSEEGLVQGGVDLSQTVKSNTLIPSASKQEPVMKKKKDGMLKKYTARSSLDSKLKMQSQGSSPTPQDDKVRLFTRAQAVTFTKEEEEEEELMEVTYRDAYENHKKGSQPIRPRKEDLKKISAQISSTPSETLTNEQIINIQQELAGGIGLKNLETSMEIMNMVMDENEMKAHLKSILGPKLYDEYQEHFVILRMLEIRKVASQSTNL